MEIPFCPSCGAGADKQRIRAEHVYGGTERHKFWHCSACDLVYLWPSLSEKEEAHFYAKEFEKFMEKRSGKDRDWSGPEAHIKSNQDHVKRRWEFIKDYIQNDMDVLEIGCSSGFMLDEFKKNNLNTFGVEPSHSFIDFVRERGHKVYRSIEELKETGQPDRKYDIITHFFVLEHIRNTADFIKEQLDLLKPGGIIIAEVPCVNDPLTSIYNIPAFERFYWSIAHHYYFNPKSLGYILDKLDCKYRFVAEQRYDLSNHMVWMMEGKPGGQKRYNNIFSQETLVSYANDLKFTWNCDTFFVYIKK